MAEFSCTHLAFKALGLAAGCFSVDKQTQPFCVAERGGAVLCFQLSKSSAIPSNFKALR
jgi:hypothetical protein